MIPVSAMMAERGRRRVMIWITVAIAMFGFDMAPRFYSRHCGAVVIMAIGLPLMGLTYGPLGTVLSELFPTAVRYTGSSLAFNFAAFWVPL